MVWKIYSFLRGKKKEGEIFNVKNHPIKSNHFLSFINAYGLYLTLIGVSHLSQKVSSFALVHHSSLELKLNQLYFNIKTFIGSADDRLAVILIWY